MPSLTHVSRKSWHWKLVEETWGKRAHGKVISYYLFKIPLVILYTGPFYLLYAIFMVLFMIITTTGGLIILIHGAAKQTTSQVSDFWHVVGGPELVVNGNH